MKRASLFLAGAVLALTMGAVWTRARTAGVEGARSADEAIGAGVVPQGSALVQPTPLGADTKPTQEDSRAAVAQDARGELVLLDPGGAPLAGAAWAVFRGEEVLASGSTGEGGAARFELDQEGDVELAVAHPLHPVLRRALERDALPRSVALEEGAAVAGRILLDGSPPLLPIELTLEQVSFWGAGLPDTVCKALHGGRPEDRALATGNEGAFRFPGLAPSWNGKLRWEADALLEPEGELPFGLISGEQDLRLGAPDAGLVLRLVTPCEITGQVLDPTTGQGLVNGRARCAWLAPGGSSWVEARPDDRGNFRLALPSRLPERCELTVADDREGLGARTYELEIPPGARSYDAGARAVGALREVAFHVRGASGEPIEDAVLACHDAPRQWRSTGPDGQGSVTAGPGDTALRATALGYAPADVVLRSAAQTLDIVLQPDTTLEVRLEPARDGVYVLSGVRPGLALELRLIDSHGLLLGERSVPPLETRERRIVVLPVEQLGALSGRVALSDGTPVRGALIRIVHAGLDPLNAGAVTDADGRFELADVPQVNLRLMVCGPGIAPLRSAEVAAPAEGLVLIADAGRAVRVSAVGPGGASLPGGWVDARLDGLPAYGGVALDAGGAALLEHAPQGACIVALSLGGRRFEQALSPDAGEARIAVPPWQSCALVLDQPPLRIGERRLLEVRSLDGFGGFGFPFLKGEPGEELRSDAVFPGRYVASVRSFDSFDSQHASGGVIGGPVEFEVTADAPARVGIEVRE